MDFCRIMPARHECGIVGVLTSVYLLRSWIAAKWCEIDAWLLVLRDTDYLGSNSKVTKVKITCSV